MPSISMLAISYFSLLYSLRGEEKTRIWKLWILPELCDRCAIVRICVTIQWFPLRLATQLFCDTLAYTGLKSRVSFAQLITILIGRPGNCTFHPRYKGLEVGSVLPPQSLSSDKNGSQFYPPRIHGRGWARPLGYNSEWKIWDREWKLHRSCCKTVQQIIAPFDSLVQFCRQRWWWNTLFWNLWWEQVPLLSSSLFPEEVTDPPIPEKHCWSLQIGWHCFRRCILQMFADELLLVLLLNSKGPLKIKCQRNGNNMLGPKSDY